MNNQVIICPNDEKMNILDGYSKIDNLHNIKFMNKKEFINNYYFSYDETAIQYLMDKYNYNLDVCKVYLKYLYVIDIDKDYKVKKLNFLKEIKKELLENNLLVENNAFKEYIKDKNIKVLNYYDLDKYEEEALNYKVDIPKVDLNIDVVECETLEDEVNNVCLKVIELLNNGIDINKIYLSNISNDYLYTIDRLFKYYNIPINLDMNYSIYSTKVVQDYLNTNELDLENTDNIKITRKLVNVLSSLSRLNVDSPSYKKILINKLKNTTIPSDILANAVRVKDITKCTFKDDEYVFVLGFNQDILPKGIKDIEFITDKEKEEINLYTTNELNKRNKLSLVYILSNIKNLYISYKLKSPFSSFYPSSLISDYNLNVIKQEIDTLEYSNLYNKLRLGEKLDDYYKYSSVDDTLKVLNNHYDIGYNSYSNKFTGIKNNIYLNSIKQPLNISYSSMDNYSECGFKYYVQNVLRLEDYEEKFPAFLGSLYHRILSIYKRTNFDYEQEFNKYLENREISFKERLLLVKIKKDLKELIESLKKQQLLTGYDNEYLEKKLEVPLDNKKISVVFKGFVDKIMYLEKMNEIYYSVIDYKTGYIDTNIESMKYGLHMQLPVYLYLIKYSNIFTKPVFTGIYYQNILFNYPTCTNMEDYLKQTKDRLKLQGYSTEDVSVIERFDSTYENSEYIKSMKYSDEKGFGPYTKIINEDILNGMVEYTKNYIDKTTDKILDAKFNINPVVYNGKNESCEFCSFKDICFMKEKDLRYLSKVEDLSFLGGEE
ncbi:MAG: PD-(D/E)XK nuclease family protein [Bacilli bacterium]|nr:PD-(D/E)XK nuclease family protein [Bacilli bacterium]